MARTLSVRCISHGPLHRTAAVLALYRPVTDEIVCAVNARFSEQELAVFKGIVDHIVPVEMPPEFAVEKTRAWLFHYESTTDWIMTVDHDEVPSAALIAALPKLIEATDIVNYATTRRWNFPDAEHWIDQYPWEPDWQIPLIRNDPASVHFSAKPHEIAIIAAPYRFVDLPTYHLDCVLSPYEERQTKVAHYESQASTWLEDGRPLNKAYYLPELSDLGELAVVPSDDLANIRSVLEADISHDRVIRSDALFAPDEALAPGTVSYEDMLLYWPGRSLPPSAYQAELTVRNVTREIRRELNSFRQSESRGLTAIIHNTGTEVWPRESWGAEITLGWRWMHEGSGTYVKEGRSMFTANVHPNDEVLQPFVVEAPDEPGQYVLEVDVVHEHVRWFGNPATIVSTVSSRSTNDIK